MPWPADRQFVDKDGKITNPWMGQLEKLKPLLEVSPQKWKALLALLDAQGEDGSTVLDLAGLPIDNEPLLDEDWLVSVKNSDMAGHRVPMSAFESQGKTLIETVDLAGLSTYTFAVPAGYVDVEIQYHGVDPSANTNPVIRFSEDGGGTSLNQVYNIYAESFGQANSATSGVLSVSTLTSGSVTGVTTLLNYLSLAQKLTTDHGHIPVNQVSFTGSRVLDGSTAPVNAITLAVTSGTFTAGIAQLWGIP